MPSWNSQIQQHACNLNFKIYNVYHPYVNLNVCICNFQFRSYPICGSKHRWI